MKRTGTFTLTFIAICIALNFIGANIALFLRLPIYLDTIGSLLASIVLGPWLGILTAILSALLSWATTDIFALFFSPVALLLVLLVGYFIRGNEPLKTLWWKVIPISLAGTILSSIITVVLFHGITSSGSSIFVQVLHGLGLNMVTASVLVQAVTDYVDRLVSLLIVLLCLKRIPLPAFQSGKAN